MAVTLVGAVLREQPGAATPEAAVERLLTGIADLDGAAIVASLAPAEVEDPERTGEVYAALGERVLRVGEVPPVEVDRILLAAEEQLSGSPDASALALLAAIELDLTDLELRSERSGDDTALVRLLDGTLGLRVDPSRLPGDAAIDAASGEPVGYDMALSEGWERDGQPFGAGLITVQVDGRWFVSLQATSDALLGAP